MTRSKIVQKIIDETPQEVRDRVKEYGDKLIVMTKNEIVARWMELIIVDEYKSVDGTIQYTFARRDHEFTNIAEHYRPEQLRYSEDYNWLHEAWVKFRDLKFDYLSENYTYHKDLCELISRWITHGTITEAFDELVKGIEWYQSLKNSENKQDLVN